jgi:murein DD-endopeptidase MepM/ murein hydrolase activator NlpD/uncharacterized protein YraI
MVILCRSALVGLCLLAACTEIGPGAGPGPDAGGAGEDGRDVDLDDPGTWDEPTLPPDAQFVWPAPAWIAATDYYYRGSEHSGSADLAVPYYTPVGAARHGVVSRSEWTSIGGYLVRIDHDDGYTTLYSHLSDPPLVSVGDQVVTGQLIGYAGRTGNAHRNGCHVHFSLARDGQRLVIPEIDYGDWVGRGQAIPGDYAPLSPLASAGEREFQVRIVPATAHLLPTPEQSATPLGSVQQGDIVTVIGSSYGYYRVRFGDRLGWLVHTVTEPLLSSVLSVRITANNANIRSGPSVDTEVVATMPSGTITTVFATEGSWYRVLHGLPTQYGWTHTSNAVQVPGFDTAVRARTANLRAGPGVDHPVLDRLELLTSIQVEDERDGWYRVTHDGNAGWIAGWLTQGRR